MDKQQINERIDALEHELAKLREIANQPDVKLVWKETPEVYTPALITAGFEGCEIEFVEVKGGSFMMGSPEGDSEASNDEKPQHSVSLDSFYISKYPITQAQWEAVMGANPSFFKGANRPVEQVSWKNAQEFIKELRQLSGKNYRLPTEAEWEYAARGGQLSKGYKYAGSNDIDEVAWYKDNSNSQTQPVGKKKPNELGIYDMSSNVWEWCSDWYGKNYYANSSVSNPQGASGSDYRVLRGGSWSGTAWNCRVSFRNNGSPSNRSNYIGFRLVLVP